MHGLTERVTLKNMFSLVHRPPQALRQEKVTLMKTFLILSEKAKKVTCLKSVIKNTFVGLLRRGPFAKSLNITVKAENAIQVNPVFKAFQKTAVCYGPILDK